METIIVMIVIVSIPFHFLKAFIILSFQIPFLIADHVGK